MVMTLVAPEFGNVFQQKRPGAVLETGALVARLELDDPSLVTRAHKYVGAFVEHAGALGGYNEKLNYVHNSHRHKLENTLAGYCLPDPYHVPQCKQIIEKFMNSLRDPSLPLLELQVRTYLTLLFIFKGGNWRVL